MTQFIIIDVNFVIFTNTGLKSIMKIARDFVIICDFTTSVFIPNKFYCNLIFMLQWS